jgi:hypothetical protein
MRPPLFLHHAQLWTNPQHNSLVSSQPAHPSSNPLESAIWRSIRPITAPRTRPLTRRCQQRRYTESDRSASLEPVWPPDHYSLYVCLSMCSCDPIDTPRSLRWLSASASVRRCVLPARHPPDGGDDVPTASLPLSRFRVRARGIGEPLSYHQPSSADILHPRLDNPLSFPDRHSLEALATPAGTVCR